MKIDNEQDLVKIIRRIVGRVLVDANKDQGNIIQEAVIQRISTDSKVVDVKVSATGEIIKNLRYQKGVDALVTGLPCLILTPDPNKPLKSKVIVF